MIVAGTFETNYSTMVKFVVFDHKSCIMFSASF